MKFARILPPISCLLLLGFAALRVQAAVTFTNLVLFNQTNGAFPNAGLIQGKDGNFYGTTASSGPGGGGTVFQMTPLGILTNLVSFNNTNGAGPRAGLVQAMDGNFYGTTYNGGSNNFGTVFQATTNGTLTTLVIFTFTTNGAYPIAGLIQGQDGNFYGTTAIGGTNSGGTAFQVTTNGTLATMVSFDISGSAGNSPYAGLVQYSDGNLYGTTYQGGTNGNGTIFKLTTNGIFTSLYSFTGTNDGANPYAGLVQGKDGSLYGTTENGGTNGFGTDIQVRNERCADDAGGIWQNEWRISPGRCHSSLGRQFLRHHLGRRCLHKSIGLGLRHRVRVGNQWIAHNLDVVQWHEWGIAASRPAPKRGWQFLWHNGQRRYERLWHRVPARCHRSAAEIPGGDKGGQDADADVERDGGTELPDAIQNQFEPDRLE